MLRYYKHQEIDKERWDQLIAEAGNGLPYAYSWYLDVVAAHWDAIVLGDYEAVMPIPYKQRFGLRQLYQPFFAQQLGVFYKISINEAQKEAFWKLIGTRYVRAHQFLNAGCHIANQSQNLQPRVNYVLSLNRDHQEIRSGYSKNTRRNLRKAELAGLQEGTATVDQLIELFRVTKGRQLEDFDQQVYARLKRLIVLCIREKKGEIKAIYSQENELLAAAFFLCSHGRMIDLFPAVSEEGRKKAAMFYLIDQLVQQHSESSLLLDFEGSMVPGVARFYRGFGAEVETYWQISRNLLPWRLPSIRNWFSPAKA